MTEGYAVTAQYYDPLAASTRGAIDRQIADALAGLDTSGGPILDIGAGTGLTTALIAAALPTAEILAIEPEPAMRAALMTRVWADPDLRQRVTILPFGALDCPLPARISGAVLSASLVHFAPDERARLWSLLADRLAHSGRIIVELQCPVAIDLPKFDMDEVRVGNASYLVSAAALALPGGRQRWEMSYCTLLDGVELVRETTAYECWTLSGFELAEEAATAGLCVEQVGEIALLGGKVLHSHGGKVADLLQKDV